MTVLRDPFGCVVLAAGAGRRFGEPKAGALLPSGERFVDAVTRLACEAGADPVLAVVPPGLQVPLARTVPNPDPLGEQIVSLRLGLELLADSEVAGVLVWPVDHPLVRLESVLAVVDGFRRTRAPVVVPTFEGRRGHPVFFARETWPELMQVARGGGSEVEGVGVGGARAVVHAHASRVAEVPVMDAGILRNIDTRADLPQDERRATDAFS